MVKKKHSHRESRLINLLGNDLLPVLVQRWGNVKHTQDGRDRHPVGCAAHKTPGADASSVSERDVGRPQGGASSGEIAFRNEALRVLTYIGLVVQDFTEKTRTNQDVRA
jgi:hypothetical protein